MHQYTCSKEQEILLPCFARQRVHSEELVDLNNAGEL